MTTATAECAAMVVFNGFNIGLERGEGGQPLACLADMCAVIGLKNPAMVAKRLPEGDVISIYTPTKSGSQYMLFVTEAGMYAVLMGSRKPIARELSRVLAGKMAELRQRSITPALSDPWPTIYAVAAGMVDLKERVETMDARLSRLEGSAIQTNVEVKIFPPALSMKARFNQIIHDIVGKYGWMEPDCYNMVYYEDYYRNHRDIKKCAKNMGIAPIDYADMKGYLPQLCGIAELILSGDISSNYIARFKQ